ncbi:TolC family protein [Fusobacterium perfoetens]|uniref:TolC family protein n=1 Tax=Fusobacterium perfoetens TaxID=852 RepID=UPI001F296290|nr:TolC family protein [Fusobacterium perfoetens]MCF2625829.1 TolC family protein [Fusobacterium perfoetens]
MKKILFIFLTLSLISYGDEVTLDDLLDKLTETSYRKEIYELEQKKTDTLEKFYKMDNYNGVKSSVTTSYDDTEQIYKTTGRAEFGDLYIEGKRNHNPENDLIFGINKNIKNMIFSENDSNLLKNDLKKEADKYTFLKNMESQKIALIALYRDYKNMEFEIKIKKNGLKTLKSEEKTLEKSFELGAIPKIELESLQYSRKNLEIEIHTLEENLKKIKTRFLYDFKIDISDKTLSNIEPNYKEINEYISTIGYKDIEKLRIEKDIIKENIRYMNYNDKVPDFSLGLERDTRLDENRIVFKISKPLFYYNADLENERTSFKQQEILLNQKIEENAAEKLNIETTYANYIKEYKVLRNKADLEKNKYEIKKLEYSLGKIDYLEVMESFDDYMEYEVSQEKAKNILNSYVYEIMVRGE